MGGAGEPSPEEDLPDELRCEKPRFEGESVCEDHCDKVKGHEKDEARVSGSEKEEGEEGEEGEEEKERAPTRVKRKRGRKRKNRDDAAFRPTGSAATAAAAAAVRDLAADGAREIAMRERRPSRVVMLDEILSEEEDDGEPSVRSVFPIT